MKWREKCNLKEARIPSFQGNALERGISLLLPRLAVLGLPSFAPSEIFRHAFMAVTMVREKLGSTTPCQKELCTFVRCSATLFVALVIQESLLRF